LDDSRCLAIAKSGEQAVINNQKGIKNMKTINTRDDYMAKKISHEDYYGQFVTPAIIRLVENGIGIKEIKNSSDEHFNDIPLAKWDSLHVVNYGRGMYSRLACGEKIKSAGESNSVNTGTCILKQAARIIKKSNQ